MASSCFSRKESVSLHQKAATSFGVNLHLVLQCTIDTADSYHENCMSPRDEVGICIPVPPDNALIVPATVSVQVNFAKIG